MVESGQRQQLQPTKWRAPGLACVAIVVTVSITWLRLSADSPVKDQPMATQFQFARMQYPGGIPEYLNNWYTDYPAMDKHLTVLLQRVTGIDVAPPAVVSPASGLIFNYPLIYSVEPEQMVLGPSDITNLREYLAMGAIRLADDFHGDDVYTTLMIVNHRVV